jgi:hypothetical protein
MTEYLNIYMSKLGMELDFSEIDNSKSNISTDHISNSDPPEEEKDEESEIVTEEVYNNL